MRLGTSGRRLAVRVQDAIDRGWSHVPAAAQPGTLPDLLKVLDTMREIASAIAYMHTKDIIHGNLTGSSIMLCSSRKDSRGFTAKVGAQIHPV